MLQLETDLFNILGSGRVHVRAGFRRTGERDLGDFGMFDQGLPAVGAETGHDVHHPFGETRFLDEVHERQQQTAVLLIALRQRLKTTRPDLKVVLVSLFSCSVFPDHPDSVSGKTAHTYMIQQAQCLLLPAKYSVRKRGARRIRCYIQTYTLQT